MKTFLFHVFVTLLNVQCIAQIGIGTQQPQATLDVNGTLKIGAVANGIPAKGTIRWNDIKNDFEGFNGSAWVSLTGLSGAWGSKTQYVNEYDASNVLLQYNSQGTSVGRYEYLPACRRTRRL